MSRSHRHLAASLVVAIALSPVAPLPVLAESHNDCVPGTFGCPNKILPVPPKPQSNGGGGGQSGGQGNTFVPPKPQSNTRGGDNNARQGQQGVFGQGQQGNTFVPPKPQGNVVVPPKPQGNTFVQPKPQGNTFVQPKPQGNTFVPPKPQSNTRGGDNNARQGQQGVFGQGQQGNTFVPPNPQGNVVVPPKPQGNTFVQPKPEGNTFVPPKPQSNTRGGDNNARQGQQGVFGQGQQGNTFVPPNPQGNTQNQGQQGTFGQGQQGNTFVPPKPQSNTRGGDNNARQGQQGAFGQGQQGAFGQGRPFIPFNDGRPPMAADRGANDFRPGDRTHEWHLGQGDVPDSRNYDWNRRRDHNGGMTDFEKFGLIALGAVTIGALLSNGNTVMSNSGDRVIYRDTYGNYGVYHDDDVLIRRPGDTITTQSFDDGSVATRIVQQDGSVILTVLDANGRVLRRTVTYPNGREVLLFDDTRVLPPPVVAQLPPESPVDVLYTTQTGPDLLRAAFLTKPFQAADRAFNLSQIRDIPQVRYLAPEVELTTLGFASGSSEVSPDQAQTLAVLGHVMADLIAQNPAEVFLIEGHSDAVGDPAMNLALSDARAQTTAMALTEYFGVPPQNLITQGYGATDMKSPSQGSNDANRRIVVRRITGLLPAAGQ